MRSVLLRLLPLLDPFLALVMIPTSAVMRLTRRVGVHRLPWSRKVLLHAGVFPIARHYHEPQFDFRQETVDDDQERDLPGIKWNTEEQLSLLTQMGFADELGDLSHYPRNPPEFHLNNRSFESGDAEYWYQMIRLKKPSTIIEIGSGNSTRMALRAIARIAVEDTAYRCNHICIEPYEIPWLDSCNDVTVIRQTVESMGVRFFQQLQKNDILFIDSSHVIRPRGDVLFEYLELLPTLSQGVIVHIHDIFSPRNYLSVWLRDEVRFWNEQYLLEAFLSNNDEWKIIGALNFLKHNHFAELKKVCPYVTKSREPGSFYIQRV